MQINLIFANKLRSKRMLMVFSVKSALILLPFLTVAEHESGSRKKLHLYNVFKKRSSKCNLNAQIEPVQDKYIYMYISRQLSTLYLYYQESFSFSMYFSNASTEALVRKQEVLSGGFWLYSALELSM